MEVYFAGACGVEFDKEAGFLIKELHHRLLSYHYMNESLSVEYFQKRRKDYQKILLDSGAFSVWNAGDTIDLDKYIAYILKWQDLLDLIVNLDVIPGKPGQKVIPLEEIERSAQLGFENYFYMLDKGVDRNKLIHVFHQNEDFKWLEKMLEENIPYIGISPANDRTTQEKILWLDKVMEVICDSQGYPQVKFHGFAVTSFKLMRRYPWTSVDSSTWATVAGRGILLLPVRKGNGEWDFTKQPLIVSMSQVTAKKEHYENLPELTKKSLFDYLEFHNIPLGKSEFVLVPESYPLKKGERVCSKKYIQNLRLQPPPEGKKWIERIVERGIVNNWRYRQYLNAYFINRFVEQCGTDRFEFKKKRPSFSLII